MRPAPTWIAGIVAILLFSHGDRGVAQDAVTVTPIEYVPYSVAVQVSLPENPDAHIADAAAWLSELQAAIIRRAGPRWALTVQRDSQAAWSRPSAWRDLNAAKASKLVTDNPADFIYLVQLSSTGGTLSGEVRVWEPLVSVLSPLRKATAVDSRELPEQVAQAVWELFRPRGHWQKIDDAQARLRVQAAGLGTDSALPPLLDVGEVFNPWIVLRKRDQSVDRIVPQSWTYLIAETLIDGRGQARIVSGLRNPLTLKPRGRVEFVAIAARPQWSETTITFRRQSSPPEVLAAHETQWYADQFPIDEEHPPKVARQLTDRFGKMTLQKMPEARLGWLTITSGSQLLARLPIVPGEEHQREVMLPDDSLRLQVEGQLQLVQSDLVSFVATRTALIAITRASAKKSDWEAVDARLKQLNLLPSPQSFLDRVNAIRVAAVAKARSAKDRTTEQRVSRMTDDTAELVKRYLNDDKLAVLKEEVAELRAADVEPPDAPKAKTP